MKFSAQIANDGASWDTYQKIIEVVDRGTWHTFWNYDHLVPPFAELQPHITDDVDKFEAGDVLEGWTMLAAFAALTKRVRLGCLVTAIPFRNPALLAKIAASVDHVSHGRLELGLGAGWHQGETRAYGIELGTVKQRLDRFEESLEVIKQLLTPGPARNFKGTYFTLDRAPFAPQPVQSPLPILIGGGGEKRTLALVAKYANAYNYFGNFLSSKDEYLRKCRLLDEHCATIGRDPSEIRRTLALFGGVVKDEAAARQQREFLGQKLEPEAREKLLFGSPQRIIDGLGEFLDIGIDEIIFAGMDKTPEAFQEFDEEVLRKVQPVAVTA